MRFRVLGPPLATSATGAVVGRLSAPKPQKVLALLLIHANRIVSVDTLIAELWAHEPPATALATLQTYITHIRRMLTTVLDPSAAGRARDVLFADGGGYRLCVAAGQVDLHEYEHLVAEGRLALDDADDVQGAETLGKALALWRGGALVDVPAGRSYKGRFGGSRRPGCGCGGTRSRPTFASVGHRTRWASWVGLLPGTRWTKISKGSTCAPFIGPGVALTRLRCSIAYAACSTTTLVLNPRRRSNVSSTPS
ncbi:hypothetical protein GCM10009687_67730 [Asanoa iriomotensis]|uniref:OmpR/PhoB-type domain-containing protein n=1 Tax=Asanoa iriomotensis TaxID=234613 RepID=A0ABQ4C5G6_9ACTN|nr:winged helix-turn-helix domain-containing protein [Asanoa iriomotensis]GIF58027.1 hypothetical protein Air01nite_41220 [Asanoa iriomotensis]